MHEYLKRPNIRPHGMPVEPSSLPRRRPGGLVVDGMRRPFALSRPQTAQSVQDPGRYGSAAERQADELGTRIAAHLPVLPNSSGELPEATRSVAESHLGVDLAGVVLRTGSDADRYMGETGAIAAAEGSTIHLPRRELAGQRGRQLLGHELTHVAQQRSHAVQVPQYESPRPASGVQPPGPTLADEARRWLDQVAAASEADADKLVAKKYVPGSFEQSSVRVLLDALPAAERTGKYRDKIRLMMQAVERIEVRASSGLSDQDMAKLQARYLDARALADAASQGTTSQQAHQDRVAEANLPRRRTNAWTAMTPTEQAAFKAREVAGAVSKIVTRAKAVAPELGITAAHLHFSPDTIDGASDTRYAEHDASKHRLNFGVAFAKAGFADADFVLGTVVHEVFGHAEHGGIQDSLALDIYEQARPLTRHATTAAERAGPLSSKERFGFGYQGTEIFSEIREAQYAKSPPAGSGLVVGDKPETDIRNRVGLIKADWDPKLAKALLRGLYARFSLDPRLDKKALKLFVDAVDHHFPGDNVLQRKQP